MLKVLVIFTVDFPCHLTVCSYYSSSVLQLHSLVREPYSFLFMCTVACICLPVTTSAPPVATQTGSHFHAWAGAGGRGIHSLSSSALLQAVTLCLFVLHSKYVTFLIHSSIWNIPAGVGASSLMRWLQGMWPIARESGTDEVAVRQETATQSFGLCNREMIFITGTFDAHFNQFFFRNVFRSLWFSWISQLQFSEWASRNVWGTLRTK